MTEKARRLICASFYILGLTFVGLLVSSKDDRLLGADNPYSDGTSPFVLAAKDAGLVGYDSFMNVVILVSVISIGVSCVYGGSRTLTALSQQGYAPKIFSYIDRSGRPLFSVGLCLAFGGLAYITLVSISSSDDALRCRDCWFCSQLVAIFNPVMMLIV